MNYIGLARVLFACSAVGNQTSTVVAAKDKLIDVHINHSIII